MPRMKGWNEEFGIRGNNMKGMKGALMIVIAVLLLAGCAGNQHISAGGGNSGVSGGVTQTIRF